MDYNARRAAYLRQTGRSTLTPAQRRRVRHKQNTALSSRVVDGLPRFARLRRRFDRKDTREVKAAAARAARATRHYRGF